MPQPLKKAQVQHLIGNNIIGTVLSHFFHVVFVHGRKKTVPYFQQFSLFIFHPSRDQHPSNGTEHLCFYVAVHGFKVIFLKLTNTNNSQLPVKRTFYGRVIILIVLLIIIVLSKIRIMIKIMK